MTSIDLDSIPDLVEEYAPIAYFNANEEYFPCPIEDYVAACDEVTTPGYPGLGLTLKTRDTPLIHGDLGGDLSCPVNVKVSDSTIDIQYWFFYAFNGPGTVYLKVPPNPTSPFHWESIGDHVITPCGQHEGDWEHITVRLDGSSGEVQQVFLAQHAGGCWFDPGDVSDGGRVRFFASKFGHAAYATPDRHYTHKMKIADVVEFRLLNDTSDPSEHFDAQGRTRIIGLHHGGEDISEEAGFVERPDWMKFDGRWGQILLSRNSPVVGTKIPILGFSIGDLMKKVGMYDECEKEFGPRAPWSPERGSWAGSEPGPCPEQSTP